MRVLWVIHYPVFGGPHNRVLRLASALQARGVSLTLVVPQEEGNAYARLRDAGLDVRQVSLSRVRASRDLRLHSRFLRRMPSEVASLRKLIREVGADVVVVGGLVNPHAAIAAHHEDAAVVWQVIDTRTPRIACRALTPVVRRYADTLQFGAQALIERNFGSERFACPMVVLRPYVDVELFRPSPRWRAETREQLGIPAAAEVIGTVANVNPQKGIEWFVRTAALLATGHRDRWFVVVGALPATHTEYLAALRAELRSLGIPEERFVFAGDTADVERWYPAFDVKLITSVPNSEGTTTTALESMACAVPVVAADVGAVCEAVENGVTGWIVEPENAGALAAATERLLGDVAERERMGAAGLERVRNGFSTERAAQAQVEIFRNALAHRAERHSDYLVATTK
jgi:glycosyltransferase involved in cell wall biosynthesis